MKKVWILIVMAAFFTGCSPQSMDNSKIRELEEQIVILEEKIKNLESGGAVSAKVSQAGTEGEVKTGPGSTKNQFSQTNTITLNQEITIPDIMEFSIDSLMWMDEIKPSDTSSFYSYTPDKPGETYLVLTGDIKNLSGDTMDPGDYQESTLRINDKYNFHVSWDVEEQDGTGFYSYLKPLQEAKLFIYASVTDEVKTQMHSGVLTMNILSDSNRLGYYFYPEDDDHLSFDMEFHQP